MSLFCHYYFAFNHSNKYLSIRFFIEQICQMQINRDRYQHFSLHFWFKTFQIYGNHPTFEYLLGNSIERFGESLPSQVDILRRYYNFDRNLSFTQKISELIREIKHVYQNAAIPLIHTEHIRLKLKSLIERAKLIISTRKSNTQTQKQKEEDFLRKISSQADFAAINDDISIESDSLDSPNNFENSQNSSDFEISNEEQNEIDYNTDVEYDEHMQIVDDNDYSASDEENSDHSDYKPPIKKQKISNEILKKIHMECGQNASFRVMSSFIRIGIEIAGGDPDHHNVSKSQLCKQLGKFREDEKNRKIEQMKNSNAKLLLQFDTKSVFKLNKRHLGSKERLVIIFRNDTDVIPFGPFSLDDHRAETIANKIIGIIEEYELQYRIIGIVCDTENTNTGWFSGVCVRIEEFLQKELLYFMCRHHIYDLVPKHVGQFLFGETSAPTFDYGCSELKAAWEHLNLNRFSPYDEEDLNETANYLRDNIIPVLKTQFEKHCMRDDYAELTDLALKLFGESNILTKQFLVPGSVSNARWMGRAIYAVKSFLFREQLNLDRHTLNQLRRFSLFISIVYVKRWNYCTNVFNAPFNDLEFLKELEMYAEVDREIATVAKNAFCRHLTYLSDEMVVLSLFSNQVPINEKEIMRQKLSREVSIRTENSIKHQHTEEEYSLLQLNHFVSPRSLFLLTLFDLDLSFLNQVSSNWEELASYQNAREKIKNTLVVVNDSTERALGQAANMITGQKARTEQHLQNLFTSKLNN